MLTLCAGDRHFADALLGPSREVHEVDVNARQRWYAEELHEAGGVVGRAGNVRGLGTEAVQAGAHGGHAASSSGVISTAPAQSAQVARRRPKASVRSMRSFRQVRSRSLPSGRRFSKKGWRPELS